MMGKAVEDCTSATMFSELEIAVIIQAAPTAWIKPPKLEAMLAIQMVRKVWWAKGARGETRSGTVHLVVIHAAP
jgi:hypothetical protein